MSIFMTNKQATEKISGLEARITELEADAETRDAELTAARDEIATNTETITTITAERDDSLATLKAANESLATAQADLKTAQDEVAELPAKIEAGVQNGIAALGFKGNVPESSKEDDDKSEISNLTGFEKVSAAFKAAEKKK